MSAQNVLINTFPDIPVRFGHDNEHGRDLSYRGDQILRSGRGKRVHRKPYHREVFQSESLAQLARDSKISSPRP